MPEPRFTVLYADRGNYAIGFEAERAVFDAIGATIVDARLDHNHIDRAEYNRLLKDADAVICHRMPVDREAIAAAPKLKVVVRSGVGFENLDLDALTERGIPGCNVPDYGPEDVAMHAFSMALALREQLFLFDHGLRAGVWRGWEGYREVHRLTRLTAGVVGLGRIGTEFAKRAKAIYGRVIACDPYISSEVFEHLGVEKVDFDELLQQSDVVTLHVPLTDETTHLINEAALRRMKRTAVIVNACRGKVVDQMALARALNEGWIDGAACDVWEQEPPDPNHPLFSCSNFICSPHVAGFAEESQEDLRLKQAQEVARVLSGEPPRNRVNA